MSLCHMWLIAVSIMESKVRQYRLQKSVRFIAVTTDESEDS